MANPQVNLLLSLLDQAFDHRAWHGTNLRGSIRGLDAATAAWRPGRNRHNIWEVVVHAAYWKYTVHRRLLSQKRGSFPLNGSNWFERPEASAVDEKAWKGDVTLLVETHKNLRDAISKLKDADLQYTPPTSKVNNATLITGIASHDLYHAGQIQLLKRLSSGA